MKIRREEEKEEFTKRTKLHNILQRIEVESSKKYVI